MDPEEEHWLPADRIAEKSRYKAQLFALLFYHYGIDSLILDQRSIEEHGQTEQQKNPQQYENMSAILFEKCHKDQLKASSCVFYHVKESF